MAGGVTKFEIKKFDCGKFSLWKMKVEDLLVQNDQALALKGVANKPNNMIDEERVKLDRKTISTICLCLVDSVLFNIVEEKTTKSLWEKPEKSYDTKTATNKVILKKQL